MVTAKKPSLVRGTFVSNKHVDELKANYRELRWKTNSERLGRADSLSAWFSFAMLSLFLSKSKKFGADFVRIYFGVYPENFQEVPAFAGLQTLVLVAVKKVGDHLKEVYYTNNGREILMSLNMPAICPPYCSGTTMVEGTPNDQEIRIVHAGGAFVDQDHVAKLKENYKELRWKQNSAIIGKNDSRSATFGLEMIEEFIERGKTKNATGARIYFGVYPENFQAIPEIAGMQTVVLVPTRGAENKDIISTDVKMSLNMPAICPPYCSGTTMVEGTPYDKDIMTFGDF